MGAPTSSTDPKSLMFVTGGLASCTAELVTFPIDTTKTRMQLQGGADKLGAGGRAYTGIGDCLRHTIQEEGIAGLYKGIKPSLARQMGYSGIRMCLYEPVRNLYLTAEEKTLPKDQIPFYKMFLAGGTAGGIGSAIANPTDLLKIRMQADVKGERYGGMMDAVRQIVRAEGVSGLWAGVGPTCARAVVVNAAELASYDWCKGQLGARGFSHDSVSTHFLASVGAGFFACVCANPVDLVKTRMMNQSTTNPSYSGVVDCIVKTVRNEGPLSLYKGFLPNWARLGPWCTVMFLSYEKYRVFARQYWPQQSQSAALS